MSPMRNSRQVKLILLAAALGSGALLLAQQTHDLPLKSESQAAAYSICQVNNDVLMLDAQHGKTWMLGKGEDRTPTWLPIPKIDSEKEATQLWRKSAKLPVKDGKNSGSLTIDNLLRERGYVEILLQRLRAGYLCVDLQIEGKKLFLAVDTAAPTTCLDRQRVKHLQLKWQSWHIEEGKEKPDPNWGGDYCELAKVEIGGLTVGNHGIWSHDLSDINKRLKFYSEPLLDGVLGSDVLTKLNAIIDYSATGSVL